MAELQRTLSVWGGAGMMVSIVLGAGLLTLPGLAVARAGDAALLIWGACALASVPLLAVFALLARQWPSAGGLAVILSKGYGDFGYAVGSYLLLGAVAFGLPAIALTGGHYLAALVGGDPHAYAIALILGAVLVNLRSARVAARINAALATAVVIAMLMLLACGWVATSPDLSDAGVAPSELPGISVLTQTFMMVFFAFTGWEVAANLGGEFKSPRRDIPLAIGLSFVLVTIVYLGLALIANAAPASARPEALFAGIFDTVLGLGGRAAVSLLALCLIFANLSAAVWAVSRMVFAASGEGLLPRYLTSMRDGVPTRALILTGTGLITVGMASWSDLFTLGDLLAMAGQNFLLLYGGAAAVMLKVGARLAWRVIGGLSLALVAGLVALNGALDLIYPGLLIALAAGVAIFRNTTGRCAAMPNGSDRVQH